VQLWRPTRIPQDRGEEQNGTAAVDEGSPGRQSNRNHRHLPYLKTGARIIPYFQACRQPACSARPRPSDQKIFLTFLRRNPANVD
jgi:hypothetical protein